ncbi:alpha/beta fold hydrolase [Amycolatopsis lurida]
MDPDQRREPGQPRPARSARRPWLALCPVLPLAAGVGKHFTVVHWDRRGAGKTLRRNGKKGCGEMSFERCVADAVELAEYLRGYLNKDKIVLMAGSMGTLVGLPLVQRRPDLFSAYVCTDQFVDMIRNEEESYRLAGEHKALAKIGADPRKWDLEAWSVKMRFTMDNAVAAKLFLPLLRRREVYGLRDIPALMRGFKYSKTALFDEFMANDARKFGTKFEVPVVLIQGAQDRVTVTSLAREHFEESRPRTRRWCCSRAPGTSAPPPTPASS